MTTPKTLAGQVVRSSPLLDEMRDAAVELASYASYAEIVGAISHNRSAIRKWCDKVYEINRKIEDAEESNTHADGERASRDTVRREVGTVKEKGA